jgi:hypothetical protein
MIKLNKLLFLQNITIMKQSNIMSLRGYLRDTVFSYINLREYIHLIFINKNLKRYSHYSDTYQIVLLFLLKEINDKKPYLKNYKAIELGNIKEIWDK